MRASIPVACALALATIARPAGASSDAAWKEFDARVTRSCLAASGIRQGRASAIVGFDDRVGMVAMLVSDRARRPAPPKLCLYDKRRRIAYVDEADRWSAPPQRP